MEDTRSLQVYLDDLMNKYAFYPDPEVRRAIAYLVGACKMAIAIVGAQDEEWISALPKS